jgi:hypothetical protein
VARGDMSWGVRRHDRVLGRCGRDTGLCHFAKHRCDDVSYEGKSVFRLVVWRGRQMHAVESAL